MAKDTKLVRIARIRATRKGKVLTHPQKGYKMGGQGADGRRFHYIFRHVETKKWECTCGACQYSRDKRPCKHLKQFFNGWLDKVNVWLYEGALAFPKIVAKYGVR